MSTYFIGDVHGCYDELRLLLDKVGFKPHKDRLVFVGDLINRGGKSLETLRFIRSLGDSAVVVLGNHDISFIAYMAGVYHGKGSDFPEMSKAEDAIELADWLRQQSILFCDEQSAVMVTHAGILPCWSLKKASKQAKKVEKALRSEKYVEYLKVAYRKGSDQWNDQKDRYEKFRYRLNVFTRLRYCTSAGEGDYQEKCSLGKQKKGLDAWFNLRKKYQDDGKACIIFGHWAALGYREEKNAICLDSGCVWGGELTAIAKKQKSWKRINVKSLQKKTQ